MRFSMFITSLLFAGFLYMPAIASETSAGSWLGTYKASSANKNCKGNALIINVTSSLIGGGVPYQFGRLKGQVEADGTIAFKRTYFGKSYFFDGRINKNKISGIWKTKSNKCFGTWSAERPNASIKGL